ncbi:fumarylacetoacetase [Platysternon megacephalum]|uniref:Syndecan n=1 Tax=Platysternon megacephalum TaxID=55544 RepID=A0A4D9ES14_9SAUR|nr:fumarylacetoacetase [Platysternon megacephalum]
MLAGKAGGRQAGDAQPGWTRRSQPQPQPQPGASPGFAPPLPHRSRRRPGLGRCPPGLPGCIGNKGDSPPPAAPPGTKMPRLAPGPRALGQLLPLLLLLAGHAALAQRWRNENYERPVDLEGSGDDDPFADDESDDLYSGSGSGYFEQESGIETAVRLRTDTSITLPTTPAVLPVTSVQPVATPFEMLPAEETTPEQATSILYIPRVTEAPAIPSWKATTTSATASATPPPATAAAAASPTAPTAKPTTVPRILPPFVTTTATTRATTLEMPTAAVTEASTVTEAATSRLVTPSTARPRAGPKSSTSRTVAVTEKNTVLPPPAATLAPTDAPQTEPLDVTVSPALDNELEVPVSGGPSGDFEIREEEDTTRPELNNEVIAAVTLAAGPGLGKNAEPGLIDNTIDSGNSAAQLPQKNILERKEVLIAVIVGGVVGALFAAFLVMLLIYRMKKKDEGSYTLEEPKQANVTYQKPDKQEEFYA